MRPPSVPRQLPETVGPMPYPRVIGHAPTGMEEELVSKNPQLGQHYSQDGMVSFNQRL